MVTKICGCFEFRAVARLMCSFAPNFRNNHKSCIILFIFLLLNEIKQKIDKSNITLKLANFCLSTLPFVFIINLSFLHEHVV